MKTREQFRHAPAHETSGPGEDGSLFREAVVRSPSAVFVVQNGCYVFANPAGAWALGCAAPEDAVGLPMLETIAPEFRSAIEDRVRRAERGLSNIPIEVELAPADGTRRRMESVSAPTSWNGEPAVLVIGRDITAQHRLQQQLRAEAERARQYLEVAGVMMVALDLEGRIEMVNPKGEAILGRPAAELIGRSWFDTCLPERIREEVRHLFSRIVAGDLEPAEHVENAVLTRPGEERTIEWHNSLLRDGDGAITGTLSSGLDVTERKRVENALRERENRLASIIRAAPIGIGLTTDRVIREVNEQLCGLVRYSAAELVGEDALLLYPSKDEYERVGREKYEQIAHHGTGSVETQWRRSDGEVLDVLLSSSPIDVDDLPAGVTFTAVDITQRKRAEAELRAARSLLDKSGEMARVGGWELDLETETVRWTRATRRIHEVDDDYRPELSEALSFFPEESRTRLEAAVRDAIDNGSSYDLELDFVTAGGRPLRVHTRGIPETEDGRTTRLWGIFQDISQQHRMEQALRRLAAEVSAVEQRERRELATFLHDRIGQSLALLRMRFGDIAAHIGDDETRARVESLRDILERTIDETQSLTFQLSPPILHELGLGPALEWLGQEMCGDYGLELEFSDDGRRKPLADDTAALLYRSVRELLVNVVKHARATSVELSIGRATGTVRVTVSDDGSGFDPAGAGTADDRLHFGLYSVRERLRAVGGRLEIDSSPGEGTRAVLEAPLDSESTAEDGSEP